MSSHVLSTPITPEKLKEVLSGIKGAILLSSPNLESRIRALLYKIDTFSQARDQWTYDEWSKQWEISMADLKSEDALQDAVRCAEFAQLAFALDGLFGIEALEPFHGSKKCPEIKDIWELVSSVLKGESQEWFFIKTGAPGMEQITLFFENREDLRNKSIGPLIHRMVRIHLWLPNGNRDPESHAHQLFGQSWILTGQGHDEQFFYHNVKNPPQGLKTGGMPQMARYQLLWPDKNDSSVLSNSPNGQPAKMTKTDEVYFLEKKSETTNAIDTTYTISNKVAHRASIHDHQVHATLFVFDREKEGIMIDAPIFGPLEMPKDDNYKRALQTSKRSKSPHVASCLVNIIEAQRQLELDLLLGRLERNEGRMDLIIAQGVLVLSNLIDAGFGEYAEGYEIQMLKDQYPKWDQRAFLEGARNGSISTL
ncbi:hypothetical protein ACEPPN_015199 [Leptodophora sp. 'Broadleaf-Isolate-01']